MSTIETMKTRRTIRKFQSRKIDRETLTELIDCARLAPSAANLQPLKYAVITENTSEVFDCTAWAGYLKGEGTPREGEKPVAFIAVLADREIRGEGFELDAGAAIMSIILAAEEKGIASCWIGSINRDKLRKILDLPEQYLISSLIALGYPAEQSFAVDYSGDIKYFKDKDGHLRVPKRSIDEIIVKFQ